MFATRLRPRLLAVTLTALFVGAALASPRLRARVMRWVAAEDVDLAAGACTLDLTHGVEARRWRAGSQARATPSAEGLHIESLGEDPSVRRRVSIRAGTLGSIALRTHTPVRSAWRLYLRVAGHESEQAAVDALPLANDATTLVATLPDGPWWTQDLDGLRVDPGPEDTRATLRSVSFQAPGPGALLLGDVSAVCAGTSPYPTDLDVPEGARVRVMVGLPGGAGGGHLHAGSTRGLASSSPAQTLAPGWQEAELPLRPGTQRVRLAVTDLAGQPRAACFATPVIVPVRASERPNVLLVSLDTLRADALAEAPFLSALARRGRRFTRAYSSSNWTLPAHISLLTSQTYREHHTPGPEWRPTRLVSLPARQPSLAEVLRANGYATAATTDGGFLDASFGFSRGFERYAQWQRGKTSDSLAALAHHLNFAREFVAARGDEPFFLFVHTYVVHDYVANTSAYHEGLAPEDAAWVARGDLRDLLRARQALPPAAFLRRLYAAGVRHADRFVARLLSDLQVATNARPLLVVVTSDHGESFGEHGAWQHGSSLHEQQAHVPLLAWHSGATWRTRSWAHEVSTLDVAPSVLRAAGVPVPPTFRGASDRFTHAGPRERRAVEARAYVADLDAGTGRVEDALWNAGWKRLRTDAYDGLTLDATCYDLRHDLGEGQRADQVAPCQELARLQARLLSEGGVGRVRLKAPGRIDIDLRGSTWNERGFVAVRTARSSRTALLSADGRHLTWAGGHDDSLIFFTLPDAAPLTALRHRERLLAAGLPLAEVRASSWEQGAVQAAGWPLRARRDAASAEIQERLRALGYLDARP
jgi:arylsulfatase A-like enzyme